VAAAALRMALRLFASALRTKPVVVAVLLLLLLLVSLAPLASSSVVMVGTMGVVAAVTASTSSSFIGVVAGIVRVGFNCFGCGSIDAFVLWLLLLWLVARARGLCLVPCAVARAAVLQIGS